MQAIRLHSYGGPEQLQLDDVPVPRAGRGQVVVRVLAASVNPIDHKLGSGAMRQHSPLELPWTPGGDFAGIVEEFGPGNVGLRRGDEVYGNTPGGGSYAQFVAVSEEMVGPKPERASFVQAAGVPLAGQTAWQALFDHGQLKAGQSVLIHAAAGGVGAFAVQLAKWKGAKVFATASGDHVNFVRSLGADEVIDHTKTRFETVAKDVDLVLDLVGGETQARSLGVVKPGGRLVSVLQQPPEKETTARGIQGLVFRMKPKLQDLNALGALIDEGKLRVEICRTVALADVKDAWEESMGGHSRGKIVLEVGAA